MAIYLNLRRDAPIASVEFSPVPEGNYAFFYLAKGANSADIKAWLTRPEIGQEILGGTRMDGREVLVTRGPKTQEEVLGMLAEKGNRLALPVPEKQFKPWKWRGNLSMLGQLGQLASSQYAKGGIDVPTAIFAISNLVANGTNIAFGAEKKADINQLHFLKEKFNQKLNHYLPEGDSPPAVDERRTDLRKESAKSQSLSEKAYDFVKRNSVRGGEIGLRYFGALNLAFPITKWEAALTELGRGNFHEAFKAGSNGKKFIFYAGISYLVGKTIAFFSKVPDPYEPKPHTFIDTVREKVLFKASSLIEAVAALAIAVNGFTKNSLHFPDKFPIPQLKGKTIQRDWFGGIGGLLFAVGLTIRFFAPFGAREVDMKELNAHITDGLAKVPQDKLPQLLADTAADLKMHFKDKAPEFGEIYRQLTNDLFRYHHIAVQPRSEPSQGVEVSQQVPVLQSPAHSEAADKSFTHEGLKKRSLLEAPLSSYAEKASLPMAESGLTPA